LPDPNRDAKSQAKDLWKTGDHLESGRVLFENLPKDEQVTWAVAILDFTTEWLDVWMCGIWELKRVARKRRRWRAAHQAFTKIRGTTLRLERRKTLTPVQERMLCQCFVAENVAKVIYNATDPIDPFDEDSGWWIVPCLKSCIDCLAMPEFDEAVTSMLFGVETRPV